MIEYSGKTNIEEKIKNLIEEMAKDGELIYAIKIYENREDEKISKLMFEVTNIKEIEEVSEK